MTGAQSDAGVGPLAGTRVLDVSSGVAGQFAGRLLADSGAEVVLVEPPGGAPTRRRPPFRRDGSRESLLFWHLNTSKRSKVVDLDDVAGRERLESLAATVDVVVSDAIDLAALPRRYRALVACRIREFTPGGPYEGWIGNELVHQALAGLMHATGRADREPLYGVGRRAYYSAGAAAAVAIGAALFERERSGRGQLIELSVHEVAASMSQNLVSQYSYNGYYPQRGKYAGASGVFRCVDGWVVLFCPSGRWAPLCAALELTRLADDARFVTHDLLVANWAAATAELDAVCAERTTAEIVHAAARGRSMAARVYTPADVLACEHLDARRFWRSAADVDGTERLVLGPAHRFACLPQPAPTAAPRVGGPGSEEPGAA